MTPGYGFAYFRWRTALTCACKGCLDLIVEKLQYPQLTYDETSEVVPLWWRRADQEWFALLQLRAWGQTRGWNTR